MCVSLSLFCWPLHVEITSILYSPVLQVLNPSWTWHQGMPDEILPADWILNWLEQLEVCSETNKFYKRHWNQSTNIEMYFVAVESSYALDAQTCQIIHHILEKGLFFHEVFTICPYPSRPRTLFFKSSVKKCQFQLFNF